MVNITYMFVAQMSKADELQKLFPFLFSEHKNKQSVRKTWMRC